MSKELPFSRVRIGALTILGMLALTIVAIAFSTMYVVNVGHAVIIVDTVSHTIDPNPRIGPGWFFKMPWQDVKNIYTATDTVDMNTDYDPKTGLPLKSGPWPALDVPTAEGLQLHMDVSVRWHISASKVLGMVQAFPGNPEQEIKDKVIFNAIREVVRDTTGKNSAIDLYGPKRDTISGQIKEALRLRLLNDPVVPNTVELEDFYMRQVFLPIDFAKSVEAKQVAQQNLEKAQFERQTLLVQANATAQAAVIQAQGIAEAVRIVAAQFKSLSPAELKAYLTLKYIEALNNGMVSGNKVILLLPGSTGNFILELPNTTTS